jgi:hypothetical protein
MFCRKKCKKVLCFVFVKSKMNTLSIFMALCQSRGQIIASNPTLNYNYIYLLIFIILSDMRANTDEANFIENGEINKTDPDFWDTKKGRRKLRWRQFMALQTKRFHHTRRNPKALFCEVNITQIYLKSNFKLNDEYLPDYFACRVRLPRLCVHNDHAWARRGASSRTSSMDVHRTQQHVFGSAIS